MVLKNILRVPGLYWKLCRYAKHTERYPEMEKYTHIRRIMNLAVRSGNIDLQVYGKENVPQENGFLMCGNHQGMFDVVALVSAYEGPLAAVFKKELSNVPFLKQIIACSKSFSMDREDVRQSLTVIQAVTKELKEGRSYLIFPEGTRNKGASGLLPFKEGSFKIAEKTGCAIIPMALTNTDDIFENHFPKIVPTTVVLEYGKPIYPNDLEKEQRKKLGAHCQQLVEDMLARNSN